MEKAKRAMIESIPRLKGLVKEAERLEYEVVPKSPDEHMEYDQLIATGNLIADVVERLEYLCRPVSETGVLRKNETGRYEIKGGEFTSGSRLEALIHDGEKAWVLSRIEHNGDDYYIYGFPEVQLEGLTVRIRRNDS